MMEKDSQQNNKEMTIEMLMQCPTLHNQTVIIKQLMPYEERSLTSLTKDEWHHILYGKGMGDKKRQRLYRLFNDLMDQHEGVAPSNEKNSDFFRYIQEHELLQKVPVCEIMQPFHHQKRLYEALMPYQDRVLGDVTNEEWQMVESARGLGKNKKQTLLLRLQEVDENLREPLIGLTSLLKQPNVRTIISYQLPELADCLPVPNVYNVTFQELTEALHLSTHHADIQSVLHYRINDVLSLHHDALCQLTMLYFAMLYQLTHLSELIENVMDNKRYQYILKGRFIQHATLEELGDELDLTRERVRQIADKGIKEMNQFLACYHYVSLISLILSHRFVLEMEDYPVLHVMMKNKQNKLLSYVSSGVMVTKKENEPLLTAFHHFMTTIQQQCDKEVGYSITRFWEEWASQNTMPQRMVFDQLINAYLASVLSFYHLKLVNQWLVGTNWKRPQECTFLLKHLFKDGIYLNRKEDCQQFLLQYQLFFAHHAPRATDDMMRLFESYFERAEKVVRIASRAYCYKRDVSDALLNATYDFVKETLSRLPVVTRQKLNHHFQSWLKKEKLTDFQLYAAFKQRYKQDFIFSEGNVMRIFSPDTGALSTIDIFIDLLQRNQGKLAKQTILDELGIEEYTINQTVSQSHHLFFDGDDVILKGMDLLSMSLVQAMRKEGEQWLERYHFVSSVLIFKKLNQNQEWHKEFEHHHIQASSFYPYLKAVMPELEGHSYILYKKGEKIESLYAIMRYIGAKRAYCLDELKEVGKQFGFGESSIYSYINKETKDDRLFYINKQQLIYPSQLIITAEDKQKIEFALRFLMKDNGYLSLSFIKQEQWKRLFPTLNYPMTPCLMRHIMTTFLNYKCLQEGIQKENNPLVMVKASQAITFKQLLAKQLQQFKGPYIEKALCHFLVQKQLCLATKDDKLPYYILNQLEIDIDDNGAVHHHAS